MNELIKIQSVNDRKLVDARELHEFQESNRIFSTWIKDRIEKYGFIENQDYVSVTKVVERETGFNLMLNGNTYKNLETDEGINCKVLIIKTARTKYEYF